MKIYWRSKEGLEAPAGACFSLSPFLPGKALPISELVQTLPSPTKPIRILKRIDHPDRAEWTLSVTRALEQIERGLLQKVVLARETTLILEEAPDPFRVAAALSTEGAALFCIQLDERRAFLGATPERLFRREGQMIWTEALAGTRKRGDQGLLHSEKNLREFQFVQDYLAETLAPHCAGPVEFTPIGIHQTPSVEHLHSRGSAQLIPSISEGTLLEALHPTPALCGTPKKEALHWISCTEPFARQFYGGLIGWSTEEESDWMVAIRCCLLEGRIAKIYTGTGIIAGSHPEAEWNELEAKLNLYKGIFPCGP